MKIIALVLLALFLSACRPPVEDPSRWDPTVYCHTVQQAFGPDPWCIAHGHK